MQKIRIRSYIPEDLDAMVLLMVELGYSVSTEQMRSRMTVLDAQSMYATFVAEDDGIVAGMIGLRRLHGYEYDEPVVQISALVTGSAHRGRGVGRALIAHAERWAADAGASALVLTSGTKTEREGAHRFYVQLGFEVTGKRFVKYLTRNI